MTVAKILQSKGTADVVSITPDKSVADAAKILSDRRIGSLVVSEDGTRALGILSERDIVREVGRKGSACLTETVVEMMTASPICCTRSDRADDILQRMTDGRFRHMPVVEDGAMIGLITLGDVVKYRLDSLRHENEALEGMIMGH